MTFGGRMLTRKLQVFVSSTFLDLKEDRQAAVQAILSAGHIPAGMELFAAGSESQLQTIYRWIDDCDVYMLLLGGRYGTVESRSGLSYTELEFNYALKAKKPHFSLVLTERALEARIKLHDSSILETENGEKYRDFKTRVGGFTLKNFEDSKDIEIATRDSLKEIERNSKLFGWVSGKEINENFDEISHLKRHIEIAQSEIVAWTDKYRSAEVEISKLKHALGGHGLAANVQTGSIGNRTSTTPLSELARDMLKSAAADKHGSIAIEKFIGGTHFTAGAKQFDVSSGHRAVADCQKAVDELRKLGLIAPVDNSGDFFQVTSDGYNRADSLNRDAGS